MLLRRALAHISILLALLIAGLTLRPLAAHAADVSGAMPVLDSEEKAFVTLINNYRAQNGLGRLNVSIRLTRASAWMSDDLSRRSTFGHDDSTGRTAFQRIQAFGYDFNTYSGENIAAGNASAAATFEQWRTSAGHNQNMLNPNYTTMGIARFNRTGSQFRWYWTNDFGGFTDETVTEQVEPPPLPITPTRSAMVAVPPARILDTRSTGIIGPNGRITVNVLGKKGVPASGVSAVTLTVTVTEAITPGYVTVFPGGGGKPDNSNINVEYPGQTVANLVTVPVGPSGDIVFYTSGGGQILADVAGYYGTVGSTARAGRFRPLTPARLVDTRPGEPVIPGTSRVVHVTGLPGMSGVSAVSINLTVTGAFGPGYLTAYPAANGVPNASNLNINQGNETVAGAAIVPVDANGNIGVFMSGGGDLIVDINGWFTDGSAAASSGGLFVAQTPKRQIDTRGASTMAMRSTRDIGVPSNAIAVSANLTLTATADGGYLSAYGAGGNLPSVSSVNANYAGQTVANHAIIPASGGGVRFFSSMQTDLLVDYDGYFLPDGV